MDFRLSIVQFVYRCLKKFGRGGSLPGTLALKLDANFIRKFEMPKHVILVTGTNGKTTTSNLIAESLRKSGLKVINNHRGDNLNVGIATLLAAHSNDSYKINADAVVIEIDELTVYRQFSNLKPTMLVVNNFFRDQLDRAGEMETIIRKIMEVTKDFTGDLVLNGDDPNVLRIGENAQFAKVHYFTVAENEISRNVTDEASEGKFCPNCGRPLNYSYYQYSHIGRFHCAWDHFGEIKADLEVASVDFDSGTFESSNQKFHSFINTIYAVYNCAAVLCVMKTLGLDFRYANEVFKNYQLNEGRNENFLLSRPALLNLVKNPTGANEVLKSILARPGEKNICILLNDNDQDGHDVSWIWDAHFERLDDPLVKTIICSGLRAYDMALRLKYENIKPEVIVIENSKQAIKWLDEAKRDSYVIATYTALHPIRAILKKRAKK